MGYSNFKKIRTVIKRFDLDMQLVDLFDAPTPVEPSAWLKETIRKAHNTPLINEKSKAERIVSPILMEVADQYTDRISFFSGEALDIDSDQDLSGACDFFFSLHPPKLYMDAPIISLAESKDEDMEWGIAQCAAQMYAADLFNQKEGQDIKVIHGCATDGVEWHFLVYKNRFFYVDKRPRTNLPEILGIWNMILKTYLGTL
ncbi:MAG: hypothetical protein AAF849_15915 [Bacteroidota bacterium]